MTSSILNILAMNVTISVREQIRDEEMKSLPAPKESIHYWSVYRKARGRRKEKFVNSFTCSKAAMAEKWNKFYRTGEFRLIHELKYGK